MHISPPPFLLRHPCTIMVYPAFLACDVVMSWSILLLIQVSVMKPMSILSTSIWCRTMSNLLMIDCIYIVRKNLVFLPFQYIMLCLGSDFSHSSCTPLFWSCIFGLFFPPLVPLDILLKIPVHEGHHLWRISVWTDLYEDLFWEGTKRPSWEGWASLCKREAISKSPMEA